MNLSYFTLEWPSWLPGGASVLLNTPVFVILFVLFFIIYAVVSGVLMYHWSMYGTGSKGVHVAKVLFLAVSVGLFFTAFLGIRYF